MSDFTSIAARRNQEENVHAYQNPGHGETGLDHPRSSDKFPSCESDLCTQRSSKFLRLSLSLPSSLRIRCNLKLRQLASMAQGLKHMIKALHNFEGFGGTKVHVLPVSFRPSILSWPTMRRDASVRKTCNTRSISTLAFLFACSNLLISRLPCACWCSQMPNLPCMLSFRLACACNLWGWKTKASQQRLLFRNNCS